jgi:hydrogenase nickel incorporation protein HypB
MDAGMTADALESLLAEGTQSGNGLSIAFLENVGNLICPAEYDTGAHRNLMILSVPEGDDKPLKYPLMFEKSDVLVITKTDAMQYFDFSMDKAFERVKRLNPDIKIFPVSAKTGEGMDALEEWFLDSAAKLKEA